MEKKTWLIVVLAILFLVGCKKEKEEVPKPKTDDSNSGSELMNSPSQFSGTIDGEEILYAEGQSIKNNFGATGLGGTYIYESSLFHSSVKNLIVLNKGSLSHSGQQPSKETFKGFFATGVVPYSKQATNGVELIYYDYNRVPWSTSAGTGNQTGSVFTIEETKGVTIQSIYYVKIVAKFNCTLYNGNQRKQLTNGVFVGLFRIN